MIGIVRNPKTFQNIADVVVTSYSLPLECQMGVTGKVTLLGQSSANFTNMLLFIERLGNRFWRITSTEVGNTEETILTVKDATAVFEDVNWFNTYHEPPYHATDLVVKGSVGLPISKDQYYFMMATIRSNHSQVEDPKYSRWFQRVYNTRNSKFAPDKMITTFEGKDDIGNPAERYVGIYSDTLNDYINSLNLDISEVIIGASANSNHEIPSLESAIKALQQHGAIVNIEYKGVEYGEFRYRMPYTGDWLRYDGEEFLIVSTVTSSGEVHYTSKSISSDSEVRRSSTSESAASVLWTGQIIGNEVRMTGLGHGDLVPQSGDIVRGGAANSYYVLQSVHYDSQMHMYIGLIATAGVITATNKVFEQEVFGNTVDCISFAESDTEWTNHDIQQSTVIDISRGKTVVTPIYFNDGHAFLTKESYSNDVVSYVQFIDPQNRYYAYYLNDSLLVTSDSTQQIQGQSAYKISDDDIADWNSGIDLANEVFSANRFEHQIEFRSDKEYHIGQPVKLMLERGILDTVISKVSIESSDNLLHYTCGELPTTATEHIQSNSWSYGRRLPVSPRNGQLHFVTA